MKSKKSIVFIIFALLFSITLNISLCYADWLDNMLDSVDVQGPQSLAGNTVVKFGRIKTTPVINNFSPFNIQPPHMNISPCGFDMFFGGFSGLDADHFVSLAQSVMSAAPAYAFNLALGQLCSSCKNVMTELNTFVAKLNNIGFNSCQALQWAGNKLGLERIAKSDTAGKINGLMDAAAKKIEDLNKGLDDLLKDTDTNKAYDEINERLRALLIGKPVDGSTDTSIFPNSSLIQNAMAVLGICTDSSCSAWGTEGTQTIIAQVFQSPTDFAKFLRAITGDFIMQKGSNGNGQCTSATIFNCFNSWISGSSVCDGCDPAGLLSADKISALVKFAEYNGKGKVDFSFDYNGQPYDIQINLLESTNTIIFGENTDKSITNVYMKVCLDDTGNYISCPEPLEDNIRNKFVQLVTNLSTTNTSQKVAIDSKTLNYGLTPLYIAYRYSQETGSTLADQLIAQYAKMIGYVHVAGLFNLIISDSLKIIDEIQKDFAVSDIKSVDHLCKQCGSAIKDWTTTAKQNLIKYRYTLMKNATSYVDEMQQQVLNAIEKGGSAEELVNKVSVKKIKGE